MQKQNFPVNQLNGYIAKVEEAEAVGPKLKGMSSGKIFVLKDGRYCFNQNDQMYQIKKMTVTDTSGNKVSPDKVPFDTENRIAGIIKRGDKTLLVHRIKNGREYYVFPGGHNKRGETHEQTLSREVNEETGLSIKPTGLFLKLSQEGFATEYFYTAEETEQKEIKLVNPDVKKGEISKPVWVNNKTAKTMRNILPEKVAKKLFQ